MTTYRPHYRVCTAPPPSNYRAPPAGISELLYCPVSLKIAAALTLVNTPPPKFNKTSLTPDLKLLLAEAESRRAPIPLGGNSRGHIDVKDRTCPTACKVRVGGFAEAPADCLDRVCPEMFTMDLIKSATCVLRGLEAAETQKALDLTNIVTIVINSRYVHFARQQELSSEILLPPIDVAAVWFSHMLQSREFAAHWSPKHPKFASMPHIWTRALSISELREADQRARKAWGVITDQRDPCYSFDFQSANTPAMLTPVRTSFLDPGVVIRDRTWIRELLRSTGVSVDQILSSGDSSAAVPSYTSALHPHALTRRLLSEPPYENGWSCDNCKRLSPKCNPVWHCHPCSFDLCDACIAHPAHRLTKATPPPRLANKKTMALHAHELTRAVQQAAAYKHGWTCDGCKKAGKGEVWHCEPCQFDLCDKCVPNVPVGAWNCSICNHEGNGMADCCNTCNFVMCEACSLNGPLLRDPINRSAATVTPGGKLTFMQRAMMGYQRYLYLLAKWALTMESRSFAPPPIIDLFWHTHLSHPTVYRADSMRLMGSVRHHKLLKSGFTSMMEYQYHNFEERIWQAEFHESMATYSASLGVLGGCPRSVGLRGYKLEVNNFTMLKHELEEGPHNSYNNNPFSFSGPPPPPSRPGHPPPPV